MFPHPPGRSFDVEDHRVVHEPVEDGGGNDRVTEDLPPFGKPPVGGDQSRVTLLIAGVDDMEEDAGSASFDRKQTDVVDLLRYRSKSTYPDLAVIPMSVWCQAEAGLKLSG